MDSEKYAHLITRSWRPGLIIIIIDVTAISPTIRQLMLRTHIGIGTAEVGTSPFCKISVVFPGTWTLLEAIQITIAALRPQTLQR
jgi:hypothetical protein